MAMTKCKECGHDVSKKAKKCPSCGVSNPGVTTKDMLLVGVCLVIILAAAVPFFSGDDSKPEKADNSVANVDANAKAKADAEACREDLQCWGKENWSAATTRCSRAIERHAQYEVKWTDEYPDVKLSRRDWLNKDAGTLSYYGDRVQFSNGYGAFQNYIYRCDYDPASKAVLDVKLEQGRL